MSTWNATFPHIAVARETPESVGVERVECLAPAPQNAAPSPHEALLLFLARSRSARGTRLRLLLPALPLRCPHQSSLRLREHRAGKWRDTATSQPADAPRANSPLVAASIDMQRADRSPSNSSLRKKRGIRNGLDSCCGGAAGKSLFSCSFHVARNEITCGSARFETAVHHFKSGKAGERVAIDTFSSLPPIGTGQKRDWKKSRRL